VHLAHQGSCLSRPRFITYLLLLPTPCEANDSTLTGAHVDHGDITVYGGVASAYVAAWADAFGAPPEAVVHATAIVPPLVDTSVPKARKSHERPSTPELRCLAWATDQLPEVRSAVETGDH